MQSISFFCGLIIYMCFSGSERHGDRAYVVVQAGEQEADIAIDNCEILAGDIPGKKLQLVSSWIDLRQLELDGNWARAQDGRDPMPIAPLS